MPQYCEIQLTRSLRAVAVAVAVAVLGVAGHGSDTRHC
ncbi:Mycobacterium numidiamassiliense ORFan [Mycobacterium numidiamassiliense]|uniref:Mycobacterium numidiamassiliense ORFan n=1 Tax=Mycobacterium numidiamassiliense TaxID=1841861 RepID=A0A2U3P9K3_9MYCO|nr:Mycobacterium numidiamassiliense ORFan [Mycobacterium numidiamassiliense]